MPDFFTSPFSAPSMTKEARARWVKEILRSLNPKRLAGQMYTSTLPLSAAAGSVKPGKLSKAMTDALSGDVNWPYYSKDPREALRAFRSDNRAGLQQRLVDDHNGLTGDLLRPRNTGAYYSPEKPVPVVRNGFGWAPRYDYSKYNTPAGKASITPWAMDKEGYDILAGEGYLDKLPRGLAGKTGNKRMVDLVRSGIGAAKDEKQVASMRELVAKGVVDDSTAIGRAILQQGYAYHPTTNTILNAAESSLYSNPKMTSLMHSRLPSPYRNHLENMDAASKHNAIYGDMTKREADMASIAHEVGHSKAMHLVKDPAKYRGVDLTNASPEVIREAKEAEATRKRYYDVVHGVRRSLGKLGLRTSPEYLLNPRLVSEFMANYYGGTFRGGALVNRKNVMPFLGPDAARQITNSPDSALLGAAGHAITNYGLPVARRVPSPLMNV